MWKPEILEAMDRGLRRAPGERTEFLKEIRTKLEAAETFFFGDLEGMDSMVQSEFTKEMNVCVKFPYPVVLFEFVNNNADDPQAMRFCNERYNKSYFPHARRIKSAYLIEQADDGFCMYIFQKLEDVLMDANTPESMAWDSDWYLGKFAARMRRTQDGGVAQSYRCTAETDEPYGQMDQEGALVSGWLSLLMNKVLQYRNVVTRNVVPPEKLNRKRIRKGGIPLYSYKVLEVVKGAPKSKDAGVVPWGYRSPEGVRLHLCRGHEKTYTAEKPLFGKWTGTFWWQPHARGDETLGRIEKEYRVKVVEEDDAQPGR